MNREEKAQYIDDLAAELSAANILYLTDTADLTVETVNSLRRRCFQSNISLKVVKNTLLKKAMDRVEGKNYGELASLLKGSTSIMISQEANAPARLEEAIFVGDNQLVALETMKSKEELIGEIVGLLQSPAKNVLSGLKGAGGKIAGILKTLEER
jgi:large subunit ribosomal protein L10